MKKAISSSNKQHERVEERLLQLKENIARLKREKRALKEEKERYERVMSEQHVLIVQNQAIRLEKAEISLGRTYVLYSSIEVIVF